MSDQNDLAERLLADGELGAGDPGWSELRRLFAERGRESIPLRCWVCRRPRSIIPGC